MNDAFEAIAAVSDYRMRMMLIRSLVIDAESLYEAVEIAVNALSMDWPEIMRAELEVLFSDKFRALMEAMR